MNSPTVEGPDLRIEAMSLQTELTMILACWERVQNGTSTMDDFAAFMNANFPPSNT